MNTISPEFDQCLKNGARFQPRIARIKIRNKCTHYFN